MTIENDLILSSTPSPLYLKTINVPLADLTQMHGCQVHRLALAQQDRTELALKQRQAAGTAFLFVFAHLY
jgi:hypothetical protein